MVLLFGRVQRSTTVVWSLVGSPFSSSQILPSALSRRPLVLMTKVSPSQEPTGLPKKSLRSLRCAGGGAGAVLDLDGRLEAEGHVRRGPDGWELAEGG